MVAKYGAGEGFSSAWIRSSAVCLAASGEVVLSMVHSWKKFDGFGDALDSSFRDIDAVTTTLFRSSSNVPFIDTVWIPGAQVGWCFVH